VIALITCGSHALMVRQSIFPPGLYSCVAGFVDAGESLEHAVRREIREETGLDVADVAYVASQPWPIGRGTFGQLMVGFHASLPATDAPPVPTVDTSELEDARWVSRDELHDVWLESLRLRPAPLRERAPSSEATPPADAQPVRSVPGPFAIAHHLLRDWLLAGRL
jgi:NADH pyrophosphatase NudC (nudix superfamily)